MTDDEISVLAGRYTFEKLASDAKDRMQKQALAEALAEVMVERCNTGLASDGTDLLTPNLVTEKTAADDTSLKMKLHLAGRDVDRNPTDPRKDAGNYAKGHIHMHGLRISIENPKGSTRSGVSKGGVPWSNTMKANYGYIRGTKGKDGDHVDIFVGPHPDAELVYVVDQIDQDTGKFDEHKVMAGCLSLAEARALYLDHYSKGWKIGYVTPLTMQQFKEWLQSGNHKRPVSDQVIYAKVASEDDKDDEKDDKKDHSKVPILVLQYTSSVRVCLPKGKIPTGKEQMRKALPKIDIDKFLEHAKDLAGL